MRELLHKYYYESNDFGKGKGAALKFEVFQLNETVNHEGMPAHNFYFYKYYFLNII